MQWSSQRLRQLTSLVLVLVLCSASPASAAKYNNTLFGYSVDYPAWWTIDAKTLSDGVRFVMPGSDGIWMQIRVTENPEGQSLDDLLVLLLKQLSGTPEGLAAEPGLPKPVAPPPPAAGTVAGGAATETTGKPEGSGEEKKPVPSIVVGGPAGATVVPIDPAKPIAGPIVRWITLDGAEAWYAESEGQWILKCLKDGFLYELSANSKFGTMYEWYFGPFFNSFRFQQRLGK